MKISIITLGCKVNEYESQSMITQLSKDYEVVEGYVYADIYIVNTCAVTNTAEQKSRQVIAKCNKLNPNCKIILCGCAVQNNPSQFLDHQNVYSILGNNGKNKIIEYINKQNLKLNKISDDYDYFAHATKTRERQYIKVQDGCNYFCSYCIIPYTRGRSRSRNLDEIINEINSSNSSEFVLTGINLSDYKIDGKPALTKLVDEVGKTGKRFRLGSLECNVITDELLKTLKKYKNFCPHFHLSLQSACDETLKRMNRHYTISKFMKVVKNIRKYFKNVCLATDIIVGFKGETNEEFNTTKKNLKKIKFNYMHIFPYSEKKGTIAEKFKMSVDSKTKKERLKILLDLAEKYTLNFYKKNKFKTHNMLVEEIKNGYSCGYTDNYIYTYIPQDIKVGSLVKVKLIKPYLDGMMGIIK